VSLDHAILGFLKESDLSGYDLKTKGFDNISYLWPADQAQIYRTLEKLRSKRLVSVRRVRQSRKPDRKMYKLTPAGRFELDSWLAGSRPKPPSRDSLMLQLHFAYDLPDSDLVSIITNRRNDLQKHLDALRIRAAAQVDSELASAPRKQMLERLILFGAISQTRAAIDWMDDCLDTLSTASST